MSVSFVAVVCLSAPLSCLPSSVPSDELDQMIVDCPHCGQSFEVPPWNVVVLEIEPVGLFFHTFCPSCRGFMHGAWGIPSFVEKARELSLFLDQES